MKLHLVTLVALIGVGCAGVAAVADRDDGGGTDDGGPGGDGPTTSNDGGADTLASPPHASGAVYYLQDQKTVTLHLNGGPALIVKGTTAGSSPIAFPDALRVGDPYEVTVDPTSEGACWVKNGKGTVSGDVGDLDVRCVLTASANAKTDGTIAAGNGATPMVDFPGAPTLTFKTDRPASDVLLSFYAPAVQSSETPSKRAKAFFGIDVDGTVVQTIERTQSYYGDEGQSVTVLALANLPAGNHTVKARWRAEISPATVLGSSPVSLGVLGDVAYHVLDGPQVPYASVLSAAVLDSLATFDGLAKAAPTKSLGADAGAATGFVTVASLPLDGQTGKKALALFQAPETTTPVRENAGSFLRMSLDSNVVATAELFSITADYAAPTLDRAQSIASFVDLAAGAKPTLKIDWESVGIAPETGTLAAGASLGAIYLKSSATTVTAPYASDTVTCFTSPTPTVVPGLTTTLDAPRAGKALVVFQGAHMFATGGFNRPSEATVVQTIAGAETPILYAYLHNSGGYGQGSTMIAIVDVPKGPSTLDVRLRSRVEPGVAPACMHVTGADPLARSTLGALFIE